MTFQPVRKNIGMGVAGLSLALGLSACAHTMLCDSPIVARVLAEKTFLAVFQELAQHQGFQEWVVERLRGPREGPK